MFFSPALKGYAIMFIEHECRIIMKYVKIQHVHYIIEIYASNQYNATPVTQIENVKVIIIS